MTVQNPTGESLKKNPSLLWLLGAVALGLCAFLASGFIDDESANKELAAKSSETVAHEANPAKTLATEQASPDGTKKKSWRKRRAAQVPKGPGAGSVWKTMAGLVLVLILVFVGAAFAARFLKRVRMRPQGSKVLELVDVIPLGPKKQVFVLSAYGRKLVVGSTLDSMTVLSEFDEDEIAQTENDQPIQFAEKLKKSMARKPKPLSTMEVEA